jgi:hypothetical protein
MLDKLIAWHQQRAKDCVGLINRATYIPEPELTMLSEMALFHESAVRLLMTFEGGDLKRH